MAIAFEENEVSGHAFLGQEGSLIALVDKGILTVSANHFVNIGYLSDETIELPAKKQESTSHDFLLTKSVFLKRHDNGIFLITN